MSGRRASFEQAVRDLAERHQVTVTHVVLDRSLGDRAYATARHGGRITYGPKLECHGPEFTRWAAAHETAHVALGHCGALATWRERAAVVAGYAVVLPLLGVGAVGLNQHQPYGQTFALLGQAVAVVFGLGLIVGLAARARARERAADALAASWGYPVTERVAALLEAQEGRLQARTPTWLRDHPHPRDRVTDSKERP